MKTSTKTILIILAWTALAMCISSIIVLVLDCSIAVSGMVGILCGLAASFPITERLIRCHG